MGKFIVLLCFALLAMTLVMACKHPGAICHHDAECCGGLRCNRWDGWTGRCTGRAGIDSAGPEGPWGPGGPEGAGVEWPQNEPAPAQ